MLKLRRQNTGQRTRGTTHDSKPKFVVSLGDLNSNLNCDTEAQINRALRNYFKKSYRNIKTFIHYLRLTLFAFVTYILCNRPIGSIHSLFLIQFLIPFIFAAMININYK